MCHSSDIVADDDNDRYDTFLLDRQTRHLQRVSVDSWGNDHRFHSDIGIPYDNGHLVVFGSNAKLDPVIPWEYYDLGISNVFLRDLQEGTTTLIGLNHLGESERLGTRFSAALYDRTEAVLTSGANLLGEDTNGALMEDVYIRNWRTGAIELISGSPSGEQSNCYTDNGTLVSENGRYVVFSSCASNLTDDNPLGARNLFLRDRWLGTTRRLTRHWAGGEFITPPYFYLDSGAGRIIGERYVPFSAIGGELVPGGNPIQFHTYLLDIQTGEVELISRSWTSPPSAVDGWRPSMSADGRYLAFPSRSPDITADPGPTPAVYLKDRFTDEIVNVSAGLPGSSSDLSIVNISADGSTLAFTWRYDASAPQPYAGRTLIYTVSIHGTPLEPPTPEPVPSTSWTGRFAALMALLLGAWIALRRRRQAT